MKRHTDWSGWATDLGIVCFFVALPVACFSRTAALVLFALFAVLTFPVMFWPRRRR